MVECWKPVPDYVGFYQVSDQGRIRRIAGGRGVRAGRILRPRNNSDGYPYLNLWRNGHRKTWQVHTLVTEAFLGPRPDGLEVNHKNGIKDDNRVGNLEYVTHSENVKHSYDVLGRKALRGEASGQAKLTVASVRQIRRCYDEGGISQWGVAKRYGVSQMTISRIVRREIWAHVS